MVLSKSKKQKRLEKYIDKQLKKEQRVDLFEKLSVSQFNVGTLVSTKRLGQKKQKIQNAKNPNEMDQDSIPELDNSTNQDNSIENNNIIELSQVEFGSDKELDIFQAHENKPSSQNEKNTSDKTDDVDVSTQSTILKPTIGNSILNNLDKDKLTEKISSKENTNDTSIIKNQTLNVSETTEIAKPPVIVKRKRKRANRILGKIGWFQRNNLLSEDSENSDSDINGNADSDGEITNSVTEQLTNNSPGFETNLIKENNQDILNKSDQNKDSDISSEIAKNDIINGHGGDTVKSQETPKPSKNIKENVERKIFTGSKLKYHLESSNVDNSTADSSETLKPKYIIVKRSHEVEVQRSQLPIIGEEQQIMEAIKENNVVLLCGATGSGKTTQIPQFLYEAGYAGPEPSNTLKNTEDSNEDFGIIGVTQPRRVAAVSMAKRVGYELNSPIIENGFNSGSSSIVSYQIRFDNKSTRNTRIKFMTDGVLLRELCEDFLLIKYSVLVIDEAHERSLNTDILIGTLSRIIKLRSQMYENGETVAIPNVNKPGETRKALVKPLKLVIMSATMTVEDFTKNLRLFNPTPKVINVESRQYPVCIRFSRRTPVGEGAYVKAAIKKTIQIHERLPDGGILVFLTGQAEINYFCKELQNINNQKYIKENEEKDKFEIKKAKSSLDKSIVGGNNTVDALHGSVEMEDMDLDTSINFEETEPKLIGQIGKKGEKDDFDPDINSELKTDQPEKLYILPLYATLDPAQQLKVFENVPKGYRLCVVATNVAETSITIPGIRYVVDSGKVKDKHFNISTGMTKYEVGWTSQASSNQRTGRAGRVGVGYCYRLFSSNVFEQYFPKFGEPEISKLPIEQIVLLMKSNHIDNVENFPFVTPPPQSSLTSATNLLGHLGALEISKKNKITDLGNLMMLFPVSPRLAKMIILGHQHKCLGYVLAIASILTIGDPFKNELNVSELMLGADFNYEQDIDGEQDAEKSIRRKYYQMMNRLSQQSPSSDILKLLSVVGAYEYAESSFQKTKVCGELFLREKLMADCSKMIRQLAYLCVKHLSGLDFNEIISDLLKPPSNQTQIILRQIICNGFVDQIAIRSDIVASSDEDDNNGLVGYFTMKSNEIAYIHQTSAVMINKPSNKSTKGKMADKSHLFPQYIVYCELQKTSNLWMKQVTEINPSWIPLLAKTLVTFGKPLKHPVPVYNPDKTIMNCSVSATFGPKSWPLPSVKVEQKRTGTRWTISKVKG
ncbi:hypothetical protein BB558_000633 [Smittium angustum]|uniref:RNA helicase n=1 Tax=Smittium angustum TaxID=133377 RepID=A0A2U1JDM8_SMIAN|nr:hypothetical protein BB558_000633 [Smittium angustum]